MDKKIHPQGILLIGTINVLHDFLVVFIVLAIDCTIFGLEWLQFPVCFGMLAALF